MPRTFKLLFGFSFLSLIAIGLAIAGEAGPAAASTATMSLSNWLMVLPVVLVLAAAFGVHFRERRLIIQHRTTVVNPDQDHSDRNHNQATVHLSAILPPAPALVSFASLNIEGANAYEMTESRRKYRRLLDWVTNLFGSLRVFTYLPTIVTLWASADSSQYSLLTWGAWVMANGSLTVSIYEKNGRKVDNLVLVNACNTLMCLVTLAVICYLR